MSDREYVERYVRMMAADGLGHIRHVTTGHDIDYVTLISMRLDGSYLIIVDPLI